MSVFSRLLLPIMSADDRVRRACEDLYARLWDESGIYLGTLRFIFLVGAFTPYAVGVTLNCGCPPLLMFLFGSFYIIASAILPVWFGYKDHIVRDRADQRAERFMQMNLKALWWTHSGHSLAMRVVISAMLTFWYVYDANPVALPAYKALSYVSLWIYGYALGVQVRPRVFRQRNVSHRTVQGHA